MANEKSYPALIWLTFLILTWVGTSEDSEFPDPRGLCTPRNEHPSIGDLPPYPQAQTSPLSVRARVCLSPHVSCVTFPLISTLTGVYALVYEPFPNLPFLPYPTVYTYEFAVRKARWYGPDAT